MAARIVSASSIPPLPNVPEAAQIVLRGDPPPGVPVIRISRADYRAIAEAAGLFISDGESRLGIVDESNPVFVQALNEYVERYLAEARKAAAAAEAAAAEEARRAEEAKNVVRPPDILNDEQKRVVHPLPRPPVSPDAPPSREQEQQRPPPPPPPPEQKQEQPPPPPPPEQEQPQEQQQRPQQPSGSDGPRVARKRRGARLSRKPKRATKAARRAIVPSNDKGGGGNEPPKKGAAPIDFEVPDAEALELKHRVVVCENSNVYFEKQVLKQCYKHATNNLLEGEVLTVDDLDAEALALAAKATRLSSGTGEPVRCAWHDVYDGLYSTSVIHNALVKKGYRLVRVDHADYQRIPDMPAGKFLVAVEYGIKDAQGHWMNHVIAVDCDRRLVLDSQGNKPLALDRATFARKTGPNARYPRTRIARVHRVVRVPRKASVAPHAS